jgi:hypothetical protein
MAYTALVRDRMMRRRKYHSKVHKDEAGGLIVGYGRDLIRRGIHPDEGDLLFYNDFMLADSIAKHVFSIFHRLSNNRKAVVVELAWEIEWDLREREWAAFVHAVEARDYDLAAEELLKMPVAKKQKDAAEEWANMLRKG